MHGSLGEAASVKIHWAPAGKVGNSTVRSSSNFQWRVDVSTDHMSSLQSSACFICWNLEEAVCQAWPKESSDNRRGNPCHWAHRGSSHPRRPSLPLKPHVANPRLFWLCRPTSDHLLHLLHIDQHSRHSATYTHTRHNSTSGSQRARRIRPIFPPVWVPFWRLLDAMFDHFFLVIFGNFWRWVWIQFEVKLLLSTIAHG